MKLWKHLPQCSGMNRRKYPKLSSERISRMPSLGFWEVDEEKVERLRRLASQEYRHTKENSLGRVRRPTPLSVNELSTQERPFGSWMSLVDPTKSCPMVLGDFAVHVLFFLKSS